MHQIENSLLKIRAREYGAELTSLFDKRNNTEHLWQADPEIWPWHAPVLFPIVGRCLNDAILINGKAYEMQKHGFARKSNFQLLDLGETRMVFSLKADEETVKIYPYQFEFLIAYSLDDNCLHISYEVINRDYEKIWFSLGGHPAFAVPFSPGERYEDYYLEFEDVENAERHYINADGFFDGRKELALANTQMLPLRSNMFRDDALIFKNLKSHRVTIKSKKHRRTLSVDFNGFKQLGLWAKPGAAYICIEPWLGCADTAGKPVEFKDKETILSLEPGGKFAARFMVEIGEE